MNPIESGKAHEAFVLKEILHAGSERESVQKTLECPKTYAVAGALTAGVKIRKDGFRRILDPGDNTKTQVVFGLESPERIDFRSFAGESIPIEEFIARMTDEQWVLDNPDHPISFMYWALQNYANLTKAIRASNPLIIFRRRRATAYVAIGGDRKHNELVLSRAGFSAPEIDQILSSLPTK